MSSGVSVYRDAVAIDDDALAAGDSIGRYVLVRRLGQGGMGEVWLARDPALDRDVAIKLQHEQGDDDHRRALREGRALAAVAHPNVLPVFEVGIAGLRTYLVMEHVAGDNLRVHLGRRPHTKAEIVALFVAAARGLAALHGAGLVHCDFKPDNVLVEITATGTRVLICDLGLVSGSAEVHVTGGDDAAEIETTPGFGTPRYMAPEQHEGAPTTARADQYAWCVALFEAIYGRPPFRGDAQTLLAAKREGLPAPVSTTTERRIYDVIRRGLAPDPTERWPDMRAVLSVFGAGARTRSPWPYAMPIVGLAALGYVLEVRAPIVVPATEAATVTTLSVDEDPDERLAQAVQAHAEGEIEHAIALGEEAYQLALEHGDDDVAASAAARTFRWVSDVHSEREAQQWRGQAFGVLARVADDHPGWHDYDEGVFNIEYSAGRKQTAWPALATMLARAQAFPEQGARAWVVGLQFYGELASMSGDLQQADARGHTAVEAAREAFGNDHQETAAALLAAATWAARVGDGERSLAYVDEAREMYARLMSPDHVRMINFYMVEASAWDTVFEYAAAFASLALAREQQLRWVPKSRALAAQLDGQMGVFARRQGDIDLARRLQYSALVETEAEVGPDAPRTALRLHNLAILEREAGECARAHEYAERADAIYAVAYAADHPHRIVLAQAMADPCVAP